MYCEETRGGKIAKRNKVVESEVKVFQGREAEVAEIGPVWLRDWVYKKVFKKDAHPDEFVPRFYNKMPVSVVVTNEEDVPEHMRCWPTGALRPSHKDVMRAGIEDTPSKEADQIIEGQHQVIYIYCIRFILWFTYYILLYGIIIYYYY